MKKTTIQDIMAEHAAIADKLPDAYNAGRHIQGAGTVRALYSPSAKPTHLIAMKSRIDGSPVLMATDGVVLENGDVLSVLHPDAVAVGWLPVLRALKRVDRGAYASLLDVVSRMGAFTRLSRGRAEYAVAKAGAGEELASIDPIDAVVMEELDRAMAAGSEEP